MLWARARPRLFSASSLLHPAPPGAVAATPPAPLLRRPHRRVEAAPGNADSEAGGEAQSLPQGQRQLKQRQSALRQPLAEEEEYDEIHKLVQLLPPRVRERLEAHPQLLQVGHAAGWRAPCPSASGRCLCGLRGCSRHTRALP